MKFSKIAITAVLSAVATEPVWGLCDDVCFDFCDRLRQFGIQAANGEPDRICAAERSYVECAVRCMEGCPGFDCLDDVQPFLSNANGCMFTASQFC